MKLKMIKRADQELGKISENVLPKSELPKKTKNDKQKSGSPDLISYKMSFSDRLHRIIYYFKNYLVADCFDEQNSDQKTQLEY